MGGSRRPFVEDGCSVPTSGRQVSPVAHACSVRKRRALFSLHDCSSPAPAGTITVAVSAGTARAAAVFCRNKAAAASSGTRRAGEPGPEPRGDVHERACGLEVRLCTAGQTRAQRRTAPRHCGAGVGSSVCGLGVSFAAARAEQQQEEEDEAGERRRRGQAARGEERGGMRPCRSPADLRPSGA